MQIDPLRDGDLASMYRQKLDDLELADSLGFDAAFTAERHFMAQFAAASATAWIAAASQRTSRMRLGAMAYTLPIKAPVELAEDIATLDVLTNGRLEVGFGTGHRIEELVALGVDPGQRITIFQERLALLRALLSGGSVKFESGDIHVREIAVAPLAVQQPHPPLWYAGTEAMAAQWMGANGLGLAVGFKPTDQLIPAISAFQNGRASRSQEIIAAEPERPLGAIALMRSIIVGESDERVREEVIGDLLRLGEHINGEQPENTRAERRAAANGQFDTMVQNGIMIGGSAETVAESLAKAREELQFDLFLANPYAMGASPERIHTTLRLLAGPVREQLDATVASPA
jgi:alkanesulfonate monooxygenase SsuD/methylene tetrahydromethanopterin reductase-like flavin-dependent oxidoreductase (luciferase family)